MSNITLSPASGTCFPGGANCSTLGTPPASTGLCDSVAVTGLPTNVSYAVTPNGFSPCASGDYFNAGTETFTLTFSASSSATPGTYTLSVSTDLYPSGVAYTLTVAGPGGGGHGSGGTSASVNLGTVATGSAVVVVVAYGQPGGNFVTITSSPSNTYTPRSGSVTSGGTEFQYYDCINATGGSNFTVTATSHTASVGVVLDCAVYKGVVSLDADSAGWSFSAQSDTVTPTHNQCLLVGSGSFSTAITNALSSPSSGWTNDVTDGTDAVISHSIVTASTGFYAYYAASPGSKIVAYWTPGTWIIVAPAAQVPTPSGSSATFNITTTSLDNVTLSYVSGLPTGATSGFGTNPIVSGTGCTLTITTKTTTPYGTYTVNYSGTDGNTTFNFSVRIFVTGVLAPRWFHG